MRNAVGLLLATIALLVMSFTLLFTGEPMTGPTAPITEPTTAAANVACSPYQANATCGPPQKNLHYNNNFTAIADTGASHHYLNGKAPTTNFTSTATPTSVTIADGKRIQSSGQAELLLPNLPPGTEDCHIMSSFTNNLLSMGRFCDAGCTVIFTDTDVKVLSKTGALILHGFREQAGAKMWRFNIKPDQPPAEAHAAAHTPARHAPSLHVIPPDNEPQNNNQLMLAPADPPTIYNNPTPTSTIAIPTTTAPATRPDTRSPPQRSTEYHRRAYDLPSTKKLIEYLHCTVGSPVKSTFLRAVKAGNFRSFPGLSAENVARYCPTNATPTVMGHLTQVRKGLQSTRWTTATNALLAANATSNMLPSDKLLDAMTAPTNQVIFWEVPLATLFTDDFGRYPIRAMSGNQYIMLAYHDAANVILVQPFASKKDHHRIPAFNAIMKRFQARGIPVHAQVMDNEASAAYTENITEVWKCTHQKVPPDMHRRNKAERAIRTFKAHFLAILASVDPAFPRNRWDLLLPQA